MRKLVILVVVLGVSLLVAGTGLAGTVKLQNSKHDLSSGSSATIKADVVGSGGTDQICIFCHTPHRGSPVSRRPLWNHTLSADGTTLTWNSTNKTTRGTDLPSTYGDPTTGALAGSRACLSCHDGTVALGSVLIYYPQDGTSSAATKFKFSTSDTKTIADYSSTAYLNPSSFGSNHPVGVKSPASTQEGFTTFTTLGGATTGNANGVDYDASGYVQCQSCHNPHLFDIVAAPFLRKSNASSALCLVCHSL